MHYSSEGIRNWIKENMFRYELSKEIDILYARLDEYYPKINITLTLFNILDVL